MKQSLLTVSTFLILITQLPAIELPDDTKKALKEMENYLAKEKKAHLERKQKIYDYYIKGLKEQRKQATNNGHKDKATAIGKELLKIMEARGNVTIPSPSSTPSLAEHKTSIPKIEPSTKFSEVADYFDKHSASIKTIKVEIDKPSEALKISGNCLLAPHSDDKWSLFGGKNNAKSSNYKGMLQSKKKVNGQAPGALCYSINNGPWRIIQSVESVAVNGSIRFASNTHNIKMLKSRGNGSIRVRVLPTK